MNQHKQQYLSQIRTNTAYPVYRGFIGTIALIGYLLAGVYGLGALIGGLVSMKESVMSGLAILVVGSMLTFLLARLFKEAALILADLGDSTIEANSRVIAGQ